MEPKEILAELPYKPKDYCKAIVDCLNQKYKPITFEVIAFGGLFGTHNDETGKAWCTAQSGEFAGVKFYAEINLKSFEVMDEYVNFLAAKDFSNKVFRMFDEDMIWVYTELTTYHKYSLGNDIDMSFEYFCEEMESVDFLVHLFVKDENIAEEDRNKFIIDVTDKVAGKWKESEMTLLFFFMNDVEQENIKKRCYEYRSEVYDYIMEQTNLIFYKGVKI